MDTPVVAQSDFEPEESREERGEWLKFLLVDQAYALNVLQVQEILVFDDVTPVPGAPDYIVGVINVRGSIVTVVDAARRVQVDRTDGSKAEWIVILDAGGEHIGLLVDQVLEVEDLDNATMEPAPPDGPPALTGVVVDGEQMTILLDARIMLDLSEYE